MRGGGQLSWEDFRAGVRLGKRRWPPQWLGVTMLVLGVLVLYWGSGVPMVQPASIFLVLLVVVLGLRVLRINRALRRMWSHPNGAGAQVQLAASPEGLLLETAHATVLQRWHRFGRYRVNARVAVLFFDPTSIFMVIPRSYFATDDDWHAFVDLLARHLPQR